VVFLVGRLGLSLLRLLAPLLALLLALLLDLLRRVTRLVLDLALMLATAPILPSVLAPRLLAAARNDRRWAEGNVGRLGVHGDGCSRRRRSADVMHMPLRELERAGRAETDADRHGGDLRRERRVATRGPERKEPRELVAQRKGTSAAFRVAGASRSCCRARNKSDSTAGRVTPSATPNSP
jgi:hypothetical protein